VKKQWVFPIYGPYALNPHPTTTISIVISDSHCLLAYFFSYILVISPGHEINMTHIDTWISNATSITSSCSFNCSSKTTSTGNSNGTLKLILVVALLEEFYSIPPPTLNRLAALHLLRSQFLQQLLPRHQDQRGKYSGRYLKRQNVIHLIFLDLRDKQDSQSRRNHELPFGSPQHQLRFVTVLPFTYSLSSITEPLNALHLNG